MDSFERLIGRNVNEVSLDESSDSFFIAPVEYKYKVCGRKYPAEKFKLADIDYFNLISFSDLFSRKGILIIWHDESGLITDLEKYYFINDLEVLLNDYEHIRKCIDDGKAHILREGDTKYLGASRLNEKVAQPHSDQLANKRQFVLKKKYLQKIINEISTCIF